MRKRYEDFVSEFLVRLPQVGAERAAEEACVAAGYGAGRGIEPGKSKYFRNKARRILSHPDVMRAIMEVYETAGIEFDVREAVSLHVEHIRGGRKLEFDESGKPVATLPNYAALRDYFKMVIPKAPTKISGSIKHYPMSRPESRIGSPGDGNAAPLMEAHYIESEVRGPAIEGGERES
jgi:hypothetical protein